MTVALPAADDGVFSVIGYAFDAPSDERTVHVDRFGGEVVSTYGFDDYPALAKVVSQGIGLHEGRSLGLWSFWGSALMCAGGHLHVRHRPADVVAPPADARRLDGGAAGPDAAARRRRCWSSAWWRWVCSCRCSACRCSWSCCSTSWSYGGSRLSRAGSTRPRDGSP